MIAIYAQGMFFAIVLAQRPQDYIDPDKFNDKLLANLVIDSLNKIRSNANMDQMLANDVLTKAAVEQSTFMSISKKVSLSGSSKEKLTTSRRIEAYGGTGRGQEIVLALPIMKMAKTYFTYEQVASDIIRKVERSKKNHEVITNVTSFYIGIGNTLDAAGKKVYTSIVIGGLESINQGKKLRKLLDMKYSKRDYGLTLGNAKDCRNCERFDDLQALQQSIHLQQGKVLLEYGNLRKMKKLFPHSNDGIGIDIVQKQQYPCDTFNIFDSKLMHRGVFLKPIYAKDLFKKNTYQERDNRYSAYICKIPRRYLRHLGEGYEINLNVIQKGKFCKRITRTFVENDLAKRVASSGLYPDTLQEKDFTPVVSRETVNNKIAFKVPFEKNKFEFKPKDIQPLLDELAQPKYDINEINIKAFTSLEGDSIKNAVLQIKRAKSIVEALEKINKRSLINDVTTEDGWEQFFKDANQTEVYSRFAQLPKEKILDTIKHDSALRAAIEPLLAKQRYAEVELKITYQTEGKEEQNFVQYSLDEAIKANNPKKALAIQRFAISQAMSGHYSPQKLMTMQLPMKKEYTNLLINQVFLQYRFENLDTLSEKLVTQLYEIYKMAPTSEFAKFNQLVAFVKRGIIKDDKDVELTQSRIDELYKSKLIPKDEVDLLNFDFQMKIISIYDLDELGVQNKLVIAATEKIKKLFTPEGASSNTADNAIKLSLLLARHGDYRYAQKLLTPFLDDPNVPEKLIFLYISVASRYRENWFIPQFRQALSIAREKNPTRYCQLFSDPYLSIQVLEHPLIKKEFCQTCK